MANRECVGRIGGDEFSVMVIGVARFPDDADDSQALLAHARMAMYAAKNAGGNRIRYYADLHSRAKL